MEITGSFHSPALYPAAGQAVARTRPPADEQDPAPTPRPRAISTEFSDYEPRRQRPQDGQAGLSHSARQAINSYIDSDYAGGPELLNRIDVYA